MASNESKQQVEDLGEADFAKALQELAKGERTATALENSLNTMEAKIEALLEQAEKEQREIQSAARASSSSNADSSALDKE